MSEDVADLRTDAEGKNRPLGENADQCERFRPNCESQKPSCPPGQAVIVAVSLVASLLGWGVCDHRRTGCDSIRKRVAAAAFFMSHRP